MPRPTCVTLVLLCDLEGVVPTCFAFQQLGATVFQLSHPLRHASSSYARMGTQCLSLAVMVAPPASLVHRVCFACAGLL